MHSPHRPFGCPGVSLLRKAELASCLGTLLARLPDEYRHALEVTDLGDQTQHAAAEQLGLSTSGMKSRVQRGRRLLRAEVKRCCVVTLDSTGNLVDATVRAPDSC